MFDIPSDNEPRVASQRTQQCTVTMKQRTMAPHLVYRTSPVLDGDKEIVQELQLVYWCLLLVDCYYYFIFVFSSLSHLYHRARSIDCILE